MTENASQDPVYLMRHWHQAYQGACNEVARMDSQQSILIAAGVQASKRIEELEAALRKVQAIVEAVLKEAGK